MPAIHISTGKRRTKLESKWAVDVQMESYNYFLGLDTGQSNALVIKCVIIINFVNFVILCLFKKRPYV